MTRFAWALLCAAGVACLLSGAALPFRRPQRRTTESPIKIEPSVTATYMYDSTKRVRKLVFDVGNGSHATTSIATFGVRPVPQPIGFGGPDNWLGVYGYINDDSAFVWTVADSAAPQLPDGNIDHSNAEIYPGGTTRRFEVYLDPDTPNPPVVKFAALPFDTFPTGPSSQPNLFVDGVTGTYTVPTAAIGEPPRPRSLLFEGPSPNPMRKSTRFRLALPVASRLRVGVFDVSGRAIRTLIDAMKGAGEHDLEWNGTDGRGHRVAPGTYFVKMYVDGRQVGMRSVVVVR